MRPKTVCLEAPWKCVGTLVDSILRHDRNNSEAATPPKTNSWPLKNTVWKVTFIHFCGVVLLGQHQNSKTCPTAPGENQSKKLLSAMLMKNCEPPRHGNEVFAMNHLISLRYKITGLVTPIIKKYP